MEKFYELFRQNLKTPRLELWLVAPTAEIPATNTTH